jgi:hypothetical protein
MRRLNHANIEMRGNRETREISEPQSALGEGSGFFAYFAYFAVQEIARAGIFGGGIADCGLRIAWAAP